MIQSFTSLQTACSPASILQLAVNSRAKSYRTQDRQQAAESLRCNHTSLACHEGPELKQPRVQRNASWQGTSNAVVPCRAFQGRPGSLADKAQPFQLAVAPGALVALDFHSHLSAQSVCGLLAGIWDGADKVVRWVPVYVMCTLLDASGCSVTACCVRGRSRPCAKNFTCPTAACTAFSL